MDKESFLIKLKKEGCWWCGSPEFTLREDIIFCEHCSCEYTLEDDKMCRTRRIPIEAFENRGYSPASKWVSDRDKQLKEKEDERREEEILS